MTDHNARVRELVANAYDNAPAVKSILDGAGVSPADINGVDDLHKIPVTSKDKLVELHHANPPFGGFLAMDIDDLPRIYISPGPIFDPQPPNPAGWASLEMFKYVGFGRGDRVLNTFMYHLVPAGILLDEGLRAVGATVLPTGPGNTEVQIQMMTALKATGFVGQPSYLMTILDKCEEMGIAKDAVTIKKALFSAEFYTPSQRARFEGEYGMKTTSAYGTADVGLIAFSMGDMPGFCVTENVYMQVCDPQTGAPLPAGEIGEVVVTLYNPLYPLIRFGTGDLGSLAATPDPATGGRQHLLGLFGRSGEAVKVRGMFMHPNQLRFGLARFAEAIKVYQVVITRPENRDVVTLRVELQTGTEPSDGLELGLKTAVEAAARLRVDAVEFVEAGGLDPSQRTVQDARTWE
ncbi:MAG: phenylacetate--CoA ligase family protein [Anaerolineae bacterium]|nr:phenylacetate--CoA ligase family protein [Anaerolineae bacterium]